MLSEIDLYRRKIKDSGYFRLTNTSAIAQNGTFTFTLDERFKPYNDVIVNNLSTSSDALIIFNYSANLPLPKGNSVQPGIPISEITIKNLSSTSIAVGEIDLYYRYSNAKVKALGQGVLTQSISVAIGNLLK